MRDDLTLLKRWREGVETAGQELFERHFDDVYGFFRNKCASEADDLVQRTFLACVASIDRFRADSSFRTYLFTIARHELYAYLRRQQRDGQVLDFGVTSLGDVVTTPGTRIGRDRDAYRLRSALSSLSVDDQMLLEMRYWHELDATALSEVFDMPAATVRTRLRRARMSLGQKLDGDAECQRELFGNEHRPNNA
jgi:RNA polymerase sigma factor (sigma-70 family)